MNSGVTVRGTLLLVAVLAALGAYLWMVQGRPRPGAAPTEPPPLLAVAAAQVTRVELAEHGATFTAVRGASGWVDGAGRPWRGDVVSDLVEALSTLRPIMVVDPKPEDPADYGLGPDAPRLRVLGASGRPLLELEVGERNPAWNGVYARRAGRPEVLLVGAVLHWELEKLRDAEADGGNA